MPPRKAAQAGTAPLPDTQAEPERTPAGDNGEAGGEGEGDIEHGDGGARERGMEAACATLVSLAEEHGIDADSLVGDLRDGMLQEFKQRPKPWGQLLAGEQRDVVGALTQAAQLFARRAVIQIAAKGRPTIRGTLKKFSHDGAKIVATIEVPLTDDASILALNHASGKEVLIVTADANAFMGQRRDAAIADDQAGLEFEAGSDRHPPDDSDLAAAGERSLEEEGGEEDEAESGDEEQQQE